MNDAIDEEVEEQEEEECPKCPPVGAPAWMATFADMATLLMAFFVLILSFAEFNVPKFKQISGSLKNAFGVQKIVPIVEQPKGTTVLSLNFSPSPSPSVTQDMTQQTTDVTKPDLEVKQRDKDQDGGESDGAEEIVKALEDAIARGDIEVEVLGENVVVNFTPTEAKDEELPNLLQETLEAIDKAKKAAGKAEQEVLFGGLEQKLAQLAAAADAAIQSGNAASAEAKAEAEQQKASHEKAEIAEDDLKVALRQEIGQGLVAVDRQEDKVIITVGAGGAFPSGSAELTEAARKIMEEIAGVNEAGSGEITVSGHTDDVPLIFGSQFRDNWDLAAARAASVVQALEDTGKVPAGRMQAVSFGESQPVESNDTARGRATNRRIEIENNYCGARGLTLGGSDQSN
ncbi:MAG: OmpA family protein [Pseudomonadota bacterium]|nr:OmpA family protein [Pseudomonadota bacterium]